jgi:hypothetical protein
MHRNNPRELLSAGKMEVENSTADVVALLDLVSALERRIRELEESLVSALRARSELQDKFLRSVEHSMSLEQEVKRLSSSLTSAVSASKPPSFAEHSLKRIQELESALSLEKERHHIVVEQCALTVIHAADETADARMQTEVGIRFCLCFQLNSCFFCHRN